MSDLKFNCPHCQQRLGAPETVLGRTISCPACSGHIRLPEKPALAQQQPQPAQPPKPAAAPGSTPPADDVKFSCATCQTNFVVSARAAGKAFTCQRCGAALVVPGTAPAQPAAQSPAPNKMEPNKLPVLIEKVRAGDEQAGKELLQQGEWVIPSLLEGLRENTLEEPNTNTGAEHVANLLVKFRGASVRPLSTRLGKSRHAYQSLGRIGTEEAIQALVPELSSCNWRRVEAACVALGLVETPNVLKAMEALERVLMTTRTGEVYRAVGAAITAIQNRFPTVAVQKPLSLQEKVAQSKITPLKAIPVK